MKGHDYVRTIIIFGFLICVGCSVQKTDESKDFSELRDKLPQIQTPISFNSDRNFDLKSVDLPNNLILRTLKNKNYFSVFGKVFESTDFIAIIGYIPDDLGSPILVIINREGKEIDAFRPYQTAVYDIGYYRTNFVTINPDKTILFIDSLVTRKLNEDKTNELPGTDSLTVTKSKFRLTYKGKVEKIE